MRAILTVSSIIKESQGPSYTVPMLATSLKKAGVDVELHLTYGDAGRKFTFPVVSYKRVCLPLLKHFGLSFDMLRGLKKAAEKTDVIHVNGTWQFTDTFPALAAQNSKCKVVYCPRGGISKVAMSRGKLKKWLMWHLGGQKRALEATDMFHAASMKEAEEIRALGFKQPIAVIPNGIEVPEVHHKPFEKTNRKIVFFGRIHETKAADHLVEAWGRVAAEFPEWSIEIAGPDCGAVPQLKAMIEEKQIPRVTFVGEFKGRAKYEFLAQADLYVLPSLTENFGITIAEALVCGTPTIASKGCPWEGLVKNDCGWWVDIGADALEKQLREALALSPEALARLGENGRVWMQRDYTWEGIGRKMKLSYEWLVNGADKPEWVIL